MTMREVDFRRVDLNLLVVFSVLMREQSVARAADKLFLGASAVSMSLRRLRDLFGDSLFVRSGNRMVPTARAEEVAPAVEELLERAHRLVFERTRFRPMDVNRSYVLGLSESCEAGLVAPLLARLRAEAPRARLVVRPLQGTHSVEMIDNGTIELGIGHFKYPAPHHERETLCRHGFECLFDPTTATTPISLADYMGRDHVLMTHDGDLDGAVDERLRQIGLRRRVVASTGRFSSLPSWLQRSPLLATVPTPVAAELARTGSLSRSPLPFDMEGCDVQMSWHRRHNDEPSLKWLRGVVRSVVQEIIRTEIGLIRAET